MSSIRSFVVACLNAVVISLIMFTYANANNIVDMNFNTITMTVERIDEAPSTVYNYYVNISIPTKDACEGIFVEKSVDVSSGTLPQMYLHSLNIITRDGVVEVYGWIDADQVASIYQWLHNTKKSYGELTFIRNGRFSHYPISINTGKAYAEAIAKLLLCVN